MKFGPRVRASLHDTKTGMPIKDETMENGDSETLATPCHPGEVLRGCQMGR